MRRSLLLLSVVPVAGLAAYALWPDRRSPEQRVRTAVQDMVEGARTRDVARVLAQVSEQFHSTSLGDRSELRRLVAGELLRGGGVQVVTLQAEVTPEPDGRMRWVGRLAVARAGGGGLSALTEGELRQLHLDALFANEEGHWRVVDAVVGPVE
jgi:hypothetical protein